MDVAEKTVRVKQLVDTIATHDDEDSIVVTMTLEEIEAYCHEARLDLSQRMRDRARLLKKRAANPDLPEITASMEATLEDAASVRGDAVNEG